jgi:hypothetical protein
MSSKLINHSPDLSRLQNEGYELEVVGGHVLLRHVPYVTPEGSVDYGVLVGELTLAGDRTAKPATHVVHFSGRAPCHKNGSPILGIQHSESPQQLGGVTVQRSFSNKPPEGYADYHHLLTRYAEVISAPARAIDPNATAQTFKPIGGEASQSVFEYIDTNSARGRFQEVSSKLDGQKLGVVGLGGTGSYVLDLLAKCPVAEIRLFDADVFLQHNAFRAPGAAAIEELRETPAKVDYLTKVYSRMHRGVKPFRERLHGQNLHHLDGLSFVFLCMDSGPAKKEIIDHLISRGIGFADAGIGIENADGRLSGVVRVTTGTPGKHDHISRRLSFAEADDDAYSTNIQVAELNMINAALAVLKWKKLLGFYADFEHEHHTTFSIDGGLLLNEEVHP